MRAPSLSSLATKTRSRAWMRAVRSSWRSTTRSRCSTSRSSRAKPLPTANGSPSPARSLTCVRSTRSHLRTTRTVGSPSSRATASTLSTRPSRGARNLLGTRSSSCGRLTLASTPCVRTQRRLRYSKISKRRALSSRRFRPTPSSVARCLESGPARCASSSTSPNANLSAASTSSRRRSSGPRVVNLYASLAKSHFSSSVIREMW
mmetsp:Transcript_6089/g.13402  ORF Transcript_6089/g.13402 Transcript_6089/m.13402 type:complete len:205 (-) Transcript_6089:873-1487(-)